MSSPRRPVPFLLLGLTLAACGGDSPSPDASAPAPAADGAEPEAQTPAEAPTDPDDPAPTETADDGAKDPARAPETPPTPKIMAPPPPAESLTVHGLAAYEVVTLYARPDMSSTKLGYLRFGHRTMVTPKVDDQGEGCRKGWHQLASGAYACASKGLSVDADKEPYMHQPPPRPRLEDPMPYDYGVVARDGTEMWWRTADAEERKLAAEKYALLVEKEAAAAAAASGDPPPKPKPKPRPKPDPTSGDGGGEGGAKPASGDADLPGLEDLPEEPKAPPTEEELAEQRRREAEAAKRAEEQRLREEEERKLRLEKMATLPLHPEHPFLEKGFIVAAPMKIKDKGRSWWRTTRGGYLETSKVYRRGTPKVLQLGQEIPEDSGFPFGYIGDDKEPLFARQEDGKLRRVKSLEYRTFFDGVELVTVNEREYMRTPEDEYVRVSDLRLAQAQPRPEGVGEDERWIDVDLKQQLLVAYEGDRPVFTTLVSTGRRGTKEEPFDTPTGTFRIVTKHVSSSMDGNTASDGNYSIQDVPWAMFFHGNYALHGAFWHSGFGGRRSHGCINLAPGDARWLFWWVGPELPEGWHGAAAHDDAPGTVVVVR